MAKIGLLSDSINFPSLPLMKLSAWHKKQGDDVKLVDIYFEHFDKVYINKVFNLPTIKKIDQLNYIPLADEVVKGGSGYCIDIENGKEVYHSERDKGLPYEIEHIYPDYELYGNKFKDIAYGFLTRGCPNNCGFCVVAKKEGICSKKVADLSEFWNGQKKIKLLDPNILACRDREDLLKQLINSGAKIDYTQGLDARFIDDDIAKLVNQTKIEMIHFAFDLMKNEQRIIKGLEIFNKYCKLTKHDKAVYILTNYNTTLKEDWYRVKKVMELNFDPYLMIYRKGTEPKALTDLQRWCNNKALHRSVDFFDYIPRVDGKTIRELFGKEFL